MWSNFSGSLNSCCFAKRLTAFHFIIHNAFRHDRYFGWKHSGYNSNVTEGFASNVAVVTRRWDRLDGLYCS